jgi:choline dehydrogenase-like flavoprotein
LDIFTVFTDRQLQTLRAVCDALIPSLPLIADSSSPVRELYARAASDLHVAEFLDSALPEVTDPGAQLQLKLFLDALDQPLVNGLFGQTTKAFRLMTLTEQTAVLAAWSESSIPMQRQAFQAVKRLAFFMFYSLPDDANKAEKSYHNPNWAALGYDGPPGVDLAESKSIQPLRFDGTDDVTLHCDAVIVGSGAGGGVVAGELSAAGFEVIVLEKGGYHAERDFDGLELPSNQRLYENKGLLTTADLGVVVLAGSSLGGGTVVNWSASFRTPEHVTREWAQLYGVDGYEGAEYQAAQDAVSERINVNERECVANPQNSILARGGAALGYQTKVIPRNVKGCEECGFCTYGCAFGAKQSTLKTYLQDAYDRGTKIAVDINVERVLIEYGQAVGVVGTALNRAGKSIRVTVRARAVVVAAGSIHSPALLLRSGLSNAHIGRHLHLHPTTVTFGLYDEPVRGWQGAPMSRYIPDFSDLDGDGYGFVLETAPVHPGLAALTLSWANGAQHKRIMSQLDRLGNVLIITRDREGGQVTINRAGKPVLHYTLSDYDRAHLMHGVGEALKVMTAAGAIEISAPHTAPHVLRFAAGASDTERQAMLNPFLAEVMKQRWQANSFALFSAHQMSSVRMGGSPARGALDPNGESFEARNLFVADGSVLPTAVGRNPMITIMAVSHVIAQRVKARLQ